MSLSYYPYQTHLLEDVFKGACGEHGGILQSSIVRPIQYAPDLNILSVAGQMPNYHKVLIDNSINMQYHLTGYGTYYEEAVIRLVGEAIERYALMVSQLAMPPERLAFASYHDMKRRGDGKVVPFEYIQLFSQSDYGKLNSGMFKGARQVQENDIIGWLQCPSLFNAGEYVWVPLQFLFVGYRINKDAGEIRFSPGFSTGTASHKSLEKALANALCEFVEIDALMVHWYTKRQAPLMIFNEPALLEAYKGVLGRDSRFDVRIHDIRVLEEVRCHVMGTAIINKRNERPFVVYGAQGSLNPLKGAYRSFMESMAIEYLGIFGPLYSPKEYFRDPEDATITDLDTNVSYWAHPSRAEEKRRFLDALAGERRPLATLPNYETGDDQKNLQNLISDLSKVSEYAVYLDVTPPETRSQGWYVMRAFIPELITMCVPGAPYTNHPRWRKFGGIKHVLPHPLP